jgi:hypothetical protein
MLCRLILCCLSLLFVLPMQAQVLTAHVQDSRGKPIAAATVYISELKQGLITDDEGLFSLEAPEGSYRLVVACLGYTTVRTSLHTEKSKPEIPAVIVLEDLAYELPTAHISARGEDLAYTIMRKAIGLAPYYRNLIASYTAEVYLKGSLNVTKLRGLVALALDRKQRAAIRGLSGVQESVNEIQYEAPDKYTQTIKAEQMAVNINLKSLGLGDIDVQQGMSNLNIYSSRPNMPLASNAFQNYSFKYQGDSEIDGKWVAKIKVTPRRKASDLLTGYLYIVRDDWNVQFLDLTVTTTYVAARVQQQYQFVEEDILLPVGYTIDADVDGFGVGADAHFSGSIKYLQIAKNEGLAQRALHRPEPVAQASVDPKKEAVAVQRREKVEQILEKDEIKPKDMRTLRKIQEQTLAELQAEQQKARGEKPSLEVVDNYKTVKDSLRQQRDSAYWAAMRPVPLRQQERIVMAAADSIKRAPETPAGKKRQTRDMLSGVIIFGHQFNIDSTLSLSYSGLFNSWESGFNAVDGLTYGQAMQLRKSMDNEGYWLLRGRATYAFSRKVLMWNVLAEQRYWANRRARWQVEAYAQTKDYAGAQGLGLVNEWSSMLFKINPSRFYEGKGLRLNHRIDLVHGLGWMVDFLWENRSPLDNHSRYSLFYKNTREYAPNVPDESPYFIQNPDVTAPYRAAVLRMGLSYTPRQPYRMQNGRKILLASKYPTFAVEWRHGLSKLWDSQSDFDFLRFGVMQQRSFGYYNELQYQVDAGKFLNSKNVHFADFYHIYSNQSGISMQHDLLNFQLPKLYALSTPEWYVQAHVRYMAPYLALKYLPFFKNPLIRESLQVSYLLQPNMRHYTEVGYAMNGLLLLMDIGVFVGFEAGKYRSWGFRLSLPLERLSSGMKL